MTTKIDKKTNPYLKKDLFLLLFLALFLLPNPQNRIYAQSTEVTNDPPVSSSTGCLEKIAMKFLKPESRIYAQSTYYPNCSSVGCYNNNTLNVCTGSGGCINRGGCTYCNSAEFCESGLCCDKCNPDCGSCISCDACNGCPTYYSCNNTGCATTTGSCTKHWSISACGSCGTNSTTCWLYKYTVTFSAGAGGYISGTASQQVCRGSSSSNVTATPNTGHHFTHWSDSVTTATRNVTNVTANTSRTAYFEISNTAPTAPTSLLTNGLTNPTKIDAPPYFSAIFNDPDTGDTGQYYQIQVNTASNFLGTSMWDSGTQSMSSTPIGSRSPNITYNGSSLSLNGTTYYWRIRFSDNHALVGAWSSTATFTTATPPTAPTSLLTNGLTNPTGIDAPPYFSAIFNDPDTGDTGEYYQIQVNTASNFAGTSMWDSGTVSMTSTAIGSRSPNITYNGSTLAVDGSIYYWRIRFSDNHALVGAWSSTAQFTMNQLYPTSPTGLLTEGKTNPDRMGNESPRFSAIFNHDNLGESTSYYQIQVNTSSAFTGTVMWDSAKSSMPSIAAGDRSSNITYGGSALNMNEITYYWRIKFWDSLNVESPWSIPATFTTSPPYMLLDNLRLDGLRID